MTISEFRTLHKDLRVQTKKHQFKNNLASATDPTQDIPVRMIQMTANGIPLNVKQRALKFNNLKAENLSSIERRNNDTFDVFGELQQSAGQFKGKNIKTELKNEN